MVTAPPVKGKAVKIPGLGQVPRRTAIIFGAGAVIVVAYGVYRYQSNSSAAPATSTDPSANEIDPATGYPYGSSEDAAALAANANYDTGNELVGNASGGSNTTGSASGVGVTVPQTNSEWTQAAIKYLAQGVGRNAGNVSSALGKYITGEDVEKGSTDDSLIHQAIAAVGYPPQPGPKGYPPSIRYTAAPPKNPHPPHNPKPPHHPTTGGGSKRDFHYLTQRGDTAQSIATKTGVTYQTLLKENRIRLRMIHTPRDPVPPNILLTIKK